MESITITPSTQTMVNVPSTHQVAQKVEATDTQTVAKVNNQTQESAKKIEPSEVAKEFNKMSDTLNLDVKFAYNDKIDEVYINVTDKNTGRVIRKLPSEEAMKIKESMKDLVGVLFDKKG